MEDLFERLFPNPGHAETALLLIVLALVAVALWFGRKQLRVMIPVCTLVFLLAAIAIPSAIPARPYAHRAACINNLKLIEKTKAKWAEESGSNTNNIPTEVDLFGAELKSKPVCPSGGSYSSGTVGEKPRCSLLSRGHKLE
jgi:hypothetical protein